MTSISLFGRLAAFAASGAITLSIVMSSALYALPSGGAGSMLVQGAPATTAAHGG